MRLITVRVWQLVTLFAPDDHVDRPSVFVQIFCGGDRHCKSGITAADVNIVKSEKLDVSIECF